LPNAADRMFGAMRTVVARTSTLPPISPKKPYSPAPLSFVSMMPDALHCACAAAMFFSVAMAADSFALRRELVRFGIAIDAMMAMIATTIISSISVNPDWRALIVASSASSLSPHSLGNDDARRVPSTRRAPVQPSARV